MSSLIRSAWRSLRTITIGPIGKRKPLKYSRERHETRPSFYITLFALQTQDRGRHKKHWRKTDPVVRPARRKRKTVRHRGRARIMSKR